MRWELEARYKGYRANSSGKDSRFLRTLRMNITGDWQRKNNYGPSDVARRNNRFKRSCSSWASQVAARNTPRGCKGYKDSLGSDRPGLLRSTI